MKQKRAGFLHTSTIFVSSSEGERGKKGEKLIKQAFSKGGKGGGEKTREGDLPVSNQSFTFFIHN